MKKVTELIKQRVILLLNSLKNKDGITLLEMMIVITIIGILSIIVVPKIMDIPKKARISAAKQQIASFGMALDRYSLDNGTYPSTDQGLEALVTKPSSEPMPMNYNEGGYMKDKKIPMDPWGRSYVYKSPGEGGNEYEIMSYGADGREGGEGENADIKSWE